MWKPGISVSTASLGNSGVIDTLNSFDQLEATDSGWEYQPYELAGSRKRLKRRRLVPFFFFWKAYLSIRVPLTEIDPVIHRCRPALTTR